MLDFQVLVQLGIQPHNIWAFESDPSVYANAVDAIRESRFPFLKLFRGRLEQFLVTTPKRFDIIYLDACGPLPSTEQHTLSLLATALRYHRLAAPGVLVTNFAMPSEDQANEFAYLIMSYLYPKSFLEQIESQPASGAAPPPIEGAESHGFAPTSNLRKRCFLSEVSAHLSNYYGQYVTRQILDLAAIVIPWSRLVSSELWPQISGTNPKSLAETHAGRMQCLDKDWEGGDVITSSGFFPLQWTHCALHGGGRNCIGNVNYPTPPPSLERLRDVWTREQVGLPPPKLGARIAVECQDLLRTFATDPKNPLGILFNDRFSKAVNDFNYAHSMFQFCDVPTETLSFDLLVGQLSYPMHYVADAIRRWRYTAKRTEMFMDALVLDECRYIYDWMPTADLLAAGFADIEQQLVYRFALDGLVKQRRWYNAESFFGAAVVDQHEPGFQACTIPRRVEL